MGGSGVTGAVRDDFFPRNEWNLPSPPRCLVHSCPETDSKIRSYWRVPLTVKEEVGER